MSDTVNKIDVEITATERAFKQGTSEAARDVAALGTAVRSVAQDAAADAGAMQELAGGFEAVGSQAGGAVTALKNVGGALVGMVVFTAITAGIRAVIDHFEKLKRAAEEAAKAAQQALEKEGDVLARMNDELAKLRGEDVFKIRTEARIAAIDKLINKHDALKAAAKNAEQGREMFDAIVAVEKYDKELAAAGRSLEVLRALRAQLGQELVVNAAIGDQKAQNKADKEAEAARKQAAREREREEEQARRRRERLEEQFRQMDIAGTKRAEDEKLKALQDAKKRGDAIIAAQEKDLEDDRKREEKFLTWVVHMNAEAEKKMAEDQAAAAEEQARRWEDLSKTIGDSFAQGFTRSLFHAQSFEEGIKSVFDGILQAFERMIEQMVAKLMASAILGFLGSLLGGPAGFDLGKSLGGALFSGGGGGSLPPGGGVFAPGFGANASGLTVNISAMDGASVQRVVESPAFRRAVHEANRNGRG